MEKPFINPELAAALEAEKQRIDVEPYYAQAMNKGLKGNAMGFWSGTFMGMLTGGLAGIILHVVAGSILGPIAGWPIILGLAGLGGTAGGVVGSHIGAAAGAGSGIMMEFERRLRAEKLEAEVLNSPEKQMEILAKYRQNPVVEKDNTVGEIFATSKNNSAAWGKIIDPATMVLTTALCALAGAITCAGALMLAGGTFSLGALTVSSVGTAALIGAGIGSATGISFGIYYPGIFASLAQFTGHMLSGKLVHEDMMGTKSQPAPAQAIESPRDVASPLHMEPPPSAIRVATTNQPTFAISSAEYQEKIVAATEIAPQKYH